MTDDEVDAIRQVHRPDWGEDGKRWCGHCGDPWPCATRTLATTATTLRYEVQTLRDRNLNYARRLLRLSEALAHIANGDCAHGGPDPADPVGPWTTCRTHQPDRTEWCSTCIAADALENNTP